MRIEAFEGPLPDEVGLAYSRFEAEFCYPLGPGRTFRISHQGDPQRFFAAMGNAACFLVWDDLGVCASGAMAIRNLRLPRGRVQPTAYLGDLKISRRARGGRVLFVLARALESWGRKHATSGLAVVMNGTKHTPNTYTGRVGIPHFESIGKISVLLFHGKPATSDSETKAVVATSREQVAQDSHRFECHQAVVESGDPNQRSDLSPCWLRLVDGTATGCLEDTRRAKRLLANDGSEMLSAHLSSFGYHSILDAAALVRSALSLTQTKGLSQLFVCVPSSHAQDLRLALSELGCTAGDATIYGVGLATDMTWKVNPSEI